MKKSTKTIQSILIIGTSIKVLGLIYKILITRILGIEGMRLMSLITPTLSLCLCLSSLSIPTVVNQNIASNLIISKVRVRTIIISSLKITYFSSTIISLILLFSFPIYKIIYQNAFIYYPLLLCIPLIFLSNTTGVLRGYLEANNLFKKTYIATLLEQITKFTFTFSLLFFLHQESIELQVFACFLAMMISEFASFFYIIIKINKIKKIQIKKISTNGYEKNILKQAFPLTLDQLCVTITNYLEQLIFYYACSKMNISFNNSTTYYAEIISFAIPLLTFAYFGSLSIAKLSFPKITKYQDNAIMTNTILKKALFFSFLIASFNFILCFFYANESLLLLFNNNSAAHIVKNFGILYFFIYFNPIFIIILQAYKKEKKLLYATLISSLISIIFIYLLTINPTYNLSGLVIGKSIANIVKFIILLFYTLKTIKYKPNFLCIFSLFLLLIIYFLLNLFFHNIIYFFFVTLLIFLLAMLIYHHFYNNT